MSVRRICVLSAAFAAVLLNVSAAIAQAPQDPVRALVVDRSEGILWLGLPGPVKAGAVFDIKLVPGDSVMARATVIDCTPDAPYVARARFALEDPKAFIPIGAYAEATSDVIAQDRAQIAGYGAITGMKQNRLAFSAGVFIPGEESLRRETQSGWPAFQLAYRLSDTGQMAMLLGIGYYHADGTFTVGMESGKRDLRVVPLTIDLKMYSSGKKCGGRVYILLGAGAFNIDDERTVGAVVDTSNVTTFGWHAGVGWESRSGRYVQLKYTDASRSDFNGTVLSVGARF